MTRVRCATCGAALEPAGRLALCEVCDAWLCVPCARSHLCTDECASSGCRAGLCTRLVEGGIPSQRFGIPPGA